VTSNNDDETVDPKPRVPRLSEIDDSKSGRFPTRSAARWVPGLVEVEFRSSSDSNLGDEDLLRSGERIALSKQWSPQLSNFLVQNQVSTWKPSFPVLHSWSKVSREQALTSYRALGRDRFVTFRFPDDADVSAIAKQLQSMPQIVRANPVARLAPPSPVIPDPLMGTSDQITRLTGGVENQWYAVRCKLPQALARAKGRDVIIADLDWGFNEFHLDYGPFIDKRKNIFLDNESIAEGNAIDHGTAVLGLAGARLDGSGMVGFAPESTLWAIQAGQDDVVDHDDWVAALDFARTEPATKRKVVILEIQTESGGNVEAIGTISKAITDAIAANIVVCVPAGNSPGDAGFDDNGLPIPCTGSIVVGATSFNAVINRVGSKEGKRIAVYAPGDPNHDVTCSIPSDSYRNKFGGTSGAAAKVAGAVALMLELGPYLTPAQIRQILALSEIPVHNASGERVGVLLDCADALNRVSPA
jgi:subtilisin family serine protease